jgi:lysozyme family protein
MISKYNEFLLEKEFNSIVDDIFRIVESEGVWTSSNTVEWDMTEKDEDPIEEEPDIIDRGLDKLNKGLDNLRNFISKLNKEQLKSYYIRFVNKLKSLPERMRKFLLTHYTSVFLTIASLSYLVGGGEETKTTTPDQNQIKTEQIDPKIKEEIIELHKGSSFEEAQAAVKEVEAGYSDDRDDTGNYIDVPGGKRFIGTNHGISAPILDEYFKSKGVKRLLTKDDMINLSYETALKIYKSDYWDAQNLSLLCDQSVANVIYDGCVNQGIEGMSQVIRDAAKEQGVNLTGSVYAKSNLRRLNSLDQKQLFISIKKFRESRYKQAATWNRHGEGWLNRLDGIEYQTNNQA